MNLLLSGSREGQAPAGREQRQGAFMQEEKKTLGSCIGLISCYSNQSLDFQVPRLWQSSFFFFMFFSFLLIGTRESETAAHRIRKGIIGQW